MRYSSSREAASSSSNFVAAPTGAIGRSSVGAAAGSARASSGSGDSDLHYTKSGSLDMRYKSSREAASSSSNFVAASTGANGRSNVSAAAGSARTSWGSGDSDLHYTKSGSLDMRYKSSREAASLSARSPESALLEGSGASALHRTRDGSLDMRYNSSRAAAAQFASDFGKLSVQQSQVYNIPSNIPLTGQGRPDMRTKAAKEWVATQAASWVSVNVPDWVPKLKDGSIDVRSSVGKMFAANNKATAEVQHLRRKQYYQQRLRDKLFCDRVRRERSEDVRLPRRPPLKSTRDCRQMPSDHDFTRQSIGMTTTSEYIRYAHASEVSRPSERHFMSAVKDTLAIEYEALELSKSVEGTVELGRGSFGVVLLAKYNGRDVAVKRLHLEKLTSKEVKAFNNEITIFAKLDLHPNLVEFIGYCERPPCIVMEFVKLGSLAHLLHYCEDANVEAKITDGRIKKNIAFGVANGMNQLHAYGIIHGDLKPQNVLITDSYEAKVADFGFAYFRGKTSSVVETSKLEDGYDGNIGGTPGYMAPELVESTDKPEFACDVYSFGVLLNELVSEEPPFSDQYENFAARGPYGAVNYARLGKRPSISPETPALVKNLITRCWDAQHTARPSFHDIVAAIEDSQFIIPNLVD